MGTSPPSHATPEMIAWARRKSGLALDEVAQLENTTVDRLSEWENGNEMPSFAQLEKLAKRYKYPLMIFYLKSPPSDFQLVTDFRANSKRNFSPQLTFAIRQAQERQAWASGHLEDEGFPEFAYLNYCSVSDDPTTTAEKLRKLLAFPLFEQVSATRDSDSFANWKRHCEQLGVFVFSAQYVEVEEMRGCALPDRFAPAVIVNPKDSYTARTFTLIHEMVHILLGSAGVTGADDSEVSSPFSSSQTEVFCNRVAAETIVPSDDFRRQVPKDWLKRDDQVIRDLSRRYWVSRAVVALRLVETGLATKAYYKAKIPQLLSRWSEREPGIIPQHVLALSRNGESFSRLALSAFHAGDIHGGQLATLLNMRLQHLPKLESSLNPMRIQREPVKGNE